MSTTIRLLKKDRERLEKLARKTQSPKLIDALRFALSSAEREMDNYRGDVKSILNALRFARAGDGDISSKLDESLADALSEEINQQQ